MQTDGDSLAQAYMLNDTNTTLTRANSTRGDRELRYPEREHADSLWG